MWNLIWDLHPTKVWLKMMMNNMKHIVCYSGGHSSALCAIECVRKYGKENVILLNHDIKGSTCGVQIEHKDIKRFKQEVADYLQLPITYCNSKFATPAEVIESLGYFTSKKKEMLCTSYLKTKPFYAWLKENFPVENGEINQNCKIVYGFDATETNRITRKVGQAASQGYMVEFPMVWKERTILATEEVGINRPATYDIFKHANCAGCLKAGKTHWYTVYIYYNDLFNYWKEKEIEIGYSITKNYLKDLEPEFLRLKNLGVIATDKVDGRTFFANVRKLLKDDEESQIPCDCH